MQDLVVCIGSLLAGKQEMLIERIVANLLNEEGYLIIGELVWINSPSKYFLEFLELSPSDYLTFDSWRSCF
jgi:hypothetical protein